METVWDTMSGNTEHGHGHDGWHRTQNTDTGKMADNKEHRHGHNGWNKATTDTIHEAKIANKDTMTEIRNTDTDMTADKTEQGHHGL